MRFSTLPVQGRLTPLVSLILRSWRPQWVCPACKVRPTPRRGLATGPKADGTKPYYVTTPIFYVNAAPHVGHMYTMVLTDVLKRWQVLKGREALLCTGTDEHGMKVQQAAAKASSDPKPFCDKGAEVFRALASRVELSNDHFVRTTDADHREAVEYAWHLLEQKGLIYESKHEGWYSVSDETFYPESQVHLILDPPTGRKIMASIETGKEVEWTSERNYHFRLSAFREPLLKFYEDNPEWVSPDFRMQDVVSHVKAGLEDLSISRPSSRLTWGIPVPTDPSQTIYVWLDALLNYITKAGYPWAPGAERAGGWPADVQVIGKDIVRFHCVYWPAFLMALDIEPPKRILTHAHWTLGKQKMAKSTGNVVNPFFALDRFGVDTMRYYMLHDGGITDDADYDNVHIIERYKKGLQGGIGNLTSRVMRGKGWNVANAVKKYANVDDHRAKLEAKGNGFYSKLVELPERVDGHVESLRPNLALKAIMNAVYNCNAFIQAEAPWALAKKLAELRQTDTDTVDEEQLILDQMEMVVYVCAETLRLCGIMLQPYMPGKAAILLDMIGVQKDRKGWEWCRFGVDATYGTPVVDLGYYTKGALFPPLTSDS